MEAWEAQDGPDRKEAYHQLHCSETLGQGVQKMRILEEGEVLKHPQRQCSLAQEDFTCLWLKDICLDSLAEQTPGLFLPEPLKKMEEHNKA